MPRVSPIRECDIIFPSTAAGSSSQILGSLKRAHLSLSNRFRSIVSDAAFVQSVAQTYQLPLVANERCGSWYIQPGCKAGSAYFKSTDGHHGQWSFSLRRLNLTVLDLVADRGGCIIVDSTRKGKSMPDALSKTVPIWIAVLNTLIFGHGHDACRLQTPTDVVSPSEHSQIEARIPRFVESLQSLDLDVEGLALKLRGKPLQPLWLTPDSGMPQWTDSQNLCHLIVLCTASGRTQSLVDRDPTYVQGAADDSESWAHGLNADVFWMNYENLLSASEGDILAVIETIVSNERLTTLVRSPVLIRPTETVFVCNNLATSTEANDFDIIVSCTEQRGETVDSVLIERHIQLNCATGKVGSRQLRNELKKLEHLRTLLLNKPQSRILVCCKTGKDIAVGAALSVICSFFSETGEIAVGHDHQPRPNKDVIRHRLSWILQSIPDASPSRATLQSVNAYLMA